MNKKTKFLFFFLTSIVAGLSVAVVVSAWTNPSANPPGGGGALYYLNGNVGIGTAAPNYPLHIARTNGGVANWQLVLLNNDSTNGVGNIIALGDSATPEGGKIKEIRNGPGDYSLTMGTYGNADVLNVRQGNVGIGTTGPISKLQIQNGDNQYGSLGITQLALSYNTGGYAHFIRTRHNSSAANNAIDFYTSDGTLNGVFPTNAILGLSINNGNVGIGTTGPGSKLQVVGQVASNDAGLYSYGVGNPGDTNYEAIRLFYYPPESSYYLQTLQGGTGAQRPLKIYTAGTYFTSGNVGIGTTGPGQKLTIEGTSPVAEIRSGGYLMLRPSGNDWDMRLQSSGAAGSAKLNVFQGGDLVNPLMVIQQNGNVGIGTTNPSTGKLVISGGNLDMTSNRIINVADPIGNQDAATKAWVLANGGKPVFKGVTASAWGGNLGGYGGANAKCQSSYAGSHICSASELIQSGATYVTPDNSWVYDDRANNQYDSTSGWYSVSGFAIGVSNANVSWDCAGFTSTNFTYSGTVAMITTPNWNFGSSQCSLQRTIACCQ